MDLRLRELERLASSGDQNAAARLKLERERAGRPVFTRDAMPAGLRCTVRKLSPAWGHGVGTWPPKFLHVGATVAIIGPRNTERRGKHKRQQWYDVEVFGKAGNVIGRTYLPSNWLEPEIPWTNRSSAP